MLSPSVLLSWALVSNFRCREFVAQGRKNKWTAQAPPAAIAGISYQTVLGSSSMLARAFVQEVKVGSEHLLFRSRTHKECSIGLQRQRQKLDCTLGVRRETSEQGKLKAATYAEAYLKRAG
jgi:hypothetical protein